MKKQCFLVPALIVCLALSCSRQSAIDSVIVEPPIAYSEPNWDVSLLTSLCPDLPTIHLAKEMDSSKYIDTRSETLE